MALFKANREIKYLIIHCAYTKESMDIDADDIDRWHKAKGWAGIGYNHYIKFDGTRQEGRTLNRAGAHTLGYNNNSIGVCLEGGMSEDGKPKDTLTIDQWVEVLRLFREYKQLYPNLILAGHNQLNKKSCPSFDVREYADKYGYSDSCLQSKPLVKIKKG